jgi:hypothetical protein
MRSREISVIAWNKEEPKLYFHCPIHKCRLKELPGKGYWCPLGCGPSIPAVRTVYTTTPSQSTQGLGKKK